MEKRLLLFFGITFLLVSLWPRLFPPPAPAEPPTVPRETVTETEGSGEDDGDVVTREPPPRERAPTDTGKERTEPEEKSREVEMADRHEAESARVTVVETPLYRMALTNRGARMLSFQLKEHFDAQGRPYEMLVQRAMEELNIRPLDVWLDDAEKTRTLRDALFEGESGDRVSVGAGEVERLGWIWSDGEGLEVKKELVIDGGSYGIDTVVSVRDRGREIPKAIVFGAGVGDEATHSRYVGVNKGVVASRGEVALFPPDEIQEGEGGGVSITATGVASHYFAGLMVPRAGSGSYGSALRTDAIERDGEDDQREVITALLEAPTSPAEFVLYVGPKKLERLRELAPGLEQIIEFGSWMRHPALLLRAGLMAIYAHVGNYGWAIVLLTVAINIVLIPLKHYSFVSMRRMQKIAPQTQKIRERYKKVKPTDPRYQEMNKEIMALHKEHGVNPISGCLPMLLMIPFFFAFYRLLMDSIELRHAPFIGWINDLSVHDPLFVLPILMGGTQLAIQKMTPQTTADPIQAKIMGLMPIMFTVILAWAPSGLVLYWFSNNLVSMAQQTLTNRWMKDHEDAPAGAKAEKGQKAVKTVKAGKSGKKGKKRGGRGATP